MSEKEASLSIVYEEQDPRPTIPVGGAIGGRSPDGSLVIAHLYMDSATLPALEEHVVQQGGLVDLSKGSRIKRGDITRRILATLVLSPTTAMQFGQWLMEKAKESGQEGQERGKKS